MRRPANQDESSFPRDAPAETTDEPQWLDRLVVELLRRANSAIPMTGGGEADVLLDLQSHGLRCLLLRSPPEPCEKSLLSPREQEIARMVAEGRPNKSIAAVLEISTWTVGSHLRRIFAKLGVTSRAAMVARLLRK